MAGLLAYLSRPGSPGLAAVPAGLCADVLGMTGVAVTVLLAGRGQEVVWRSDGVSAQLEDLQFTLGEGPTVDVAGSGELVLEPGHAPGRFAGEPGGYLASVHQATGMISVQLSVTQAEALIRMRAYAFSQRRALHEVATDVVLRKLRFDAEL